MKKQDNTQLSTYIGVFLKGKGIVERFWRFKCPCGIWVEYPLNGLPEKDTLMPCGNPNHWAVKIDESEEGAAS